jgi:hypothetical protein
VASGLDIPHEEIAKMKGEILFDLTRAIIHSKKPIFAIT